jgi:hypothetical protein
MKGEEYKMLLRLTNGLVFYLENVGTATVRLDGIEI